MLILTAVLGRFFCGWMCPMGTTIDLWEKITGSSENSGEKANLSHVKYWIAVFIMVAGFLGISVSHFFAPQGLIYRFYTLSIFPLVNRGWSWLSANFRFLPDLELSFVDVVFRFGIVFFIILAAVFTLGRYQRRFFCRNLCPLGAILAFFSRFSFIQKKVSSDCIDCGKCIRTCKMGAIPGDPSKFKVSECVYCFDCVGECPTGAISFKLQCPRDLKKIPGIIYSFFKGKKSPDPQTSTGFSRRHFLEAAAAAGAVAALSRVDYNKKHKYQHLIRPPAAQPEEDFKRACIRCGECMKVCPTGGLQPTFLEAGLDGMMTPRLIPSAGYCEYYCNMCQKVCPTGAIQPFEEEEKPNIKLGTARIDRSMCLAWYKDEYCLVCDEHCPVKAIYWKEINGRLRPHVDEAICIGCGICENKCPVDPESAIRVYSQGEKRILLEKNQGWKQANPLPTDTPSSKHKGKPPAAGELY